MAEVVNLSKRSLRLPAVKPCTRCALSPRDAANLLTAVALMEEARDTFTTFILNTHRPALREMFTLFARTMECYASVIRAKMADEREETSTPPLSLEKGAEFMTETLPHLLVLQACDQRIQQATHTLNTLQHSLATLKEEAQVKEQAVRAWQEKITESEKVRDPLTLQIEQVKDQLQGKRYALHHLRAGQQEETVQREIALLEASKAALEEELSAVTAQIAQDVAALHQAEELAAAHHAQVLSLTSTVGDQCAAVEEKLRAAQHERTALTTGLNTFLLQEYERIFARRGGVAIVALVNETCQGCHMHLPPQMCLELQKHPRLTFCPHCQRILFVPLETNLHVVEPPSAANGTNGHHPRQPRHQAKSRARTVKKPDRAVVPPTNPAQV